MLLDVDFLDARRGWAVGYTGSEDTPQAVVLWTADGGATWVRRSLGPRGTTIQSVSFADAEHGWALGVYQRGQGFAASVVSVCLRTGDGGVTWTAQQVSRAPLNALDSTGISDVRFVGAGGLVYGPRGQ